MKLLRLFINDVIMKSGYIFLTNEAEFLFASKIVPFCIIWVLSDAVLGSFIIRLIFIPVFKQYWLVRFSVNILTFFHVIIYTQPHVVCISLTIDSIDKILCVIIVSFRQGFEKFSSWNFSLAKHVSIVVCQLCFFWRNP